MDGWSEDDMKSYNEYCLSAKNDRKTKNGIDFETSFLKQINDLCDDSGSDEENNND